MRNSTRISLLILLFCVTGLTTGKGQDQPAVIPGDIIVQIQPGYAPEKLLQNLPGGGTRQTGPAYTRKLSDDLNIFLLHVDDAATTDQWIGQLLKIPEVLHAQPNRLLEDRSTPNDSLYKDQWHLKTIGAPDAWDKTTGGVTALGDTIVVAVLEVRGIDFQHYDLFPNVWINRGEIPGDTLDNDGNGYKDDYFGLNVRLKNDNINFGTDQTHGTLVSSIVGARGNNVSGVSGVNWRTKLMLIVGNNTEADIIEGYSYALGQRKRYNASKGKQGAYVVATNFSGGVDGAFGKDYPLWCGLYDTLGKYGILNIAASTNQNVDVEQKGDVPSTCESNYVMPVTGTTKEDKKASYGYSAKYVDIAAPGQSVYACYPRATFGASSGTSFAAPQVAGAVALLHSFPSAKFAQLAKDSSANLTLYLKDVLMRSAKPLPDLENVTVSGGRLDLSAAMAIMDEKFTPSASPEIVNLFPNPVRNSFTLDFKIPEQEETSLYLFNAIGQLIRTWKVQPGGLSYLTIETGDLSAGVYFLSLATKSKQKTIRFSKY